LIKFSFLPAPRPKNWKNETGNQKIVPKEAKKNSEGCEQSEMNQQIRVSDRNQKRIMVLFFG
jgi:hypothetical protein